MSRLGPGLHLLIACESYTSLASNDFCLKLVLHQIIKTLIHQLQLPGVNTVHTRVNVIHYSVSNANID